MVARCRTVAFQGIEVMPVEAQVQLANGLAIELAFLENRAGQSGTDKTGAAGDE